MKKFYKLSKDVLFPICRSLTGSGVRKTLNIIKKEFDLLIKNYFFYFVRIFLKKAKFIFI